MDSAVKESVRERFIEKIGLITQEEGLPRIAGRIFAMLVFDGVPVSFGSISEQLEVSRASVSTSIKLLEERGMVRRISMRGDRQDYFQLNGNPYASMIEVAVKKIGQARADIQDTLNDLPQNSDVAKRISDFEQFYGNVQDALVAVHGQTREAGVTKVDHSQEKSND